MKLEIISFSYKRGLPQDCYGNGGGFVFDCRALPNPFWNERLRSYIGSDKEIVEFFEGYRDKIDSFLGAVMRLVEASISQYLTDGREHLQVAFGCTGGKHRSVYCATQFVARLSAMYPNIAIHLTHAARKYWMV